MMNNTTMSNTAINYFTIKEESYDSTSVLEGSHYYTKLDDQYGESQTRGQTGDLTQSIDVNEMQKSQKISTTFEYSIQSIDINEIRKANRAIQCQVSDEEYQSLLKQ